MISIRKLMKNINNSKPFSVCSNTIPIMSNYVIDENYDFVYETLIDKFYNILEKDLQYNQNNIEISLEKIFKFCEDNNIKINIVSDNTITIYNIKHPEEFNLKELYYVLLHEISHYITNTASNSKLLKFNNLPNLNNIDINNITNIKKELDYILNPKERSNWAFSISLELHYFNLIPSELYIKIRDDINKNNFNIYKMMKIQDELKIFYYIILYLLLIKKNELVTKKEKKSI